MSENPEPQSKENALEAVLFVYGEPMPRKKICDLLGVSVSELDTIAASLKQRLSDVKSSLMLLESGERLALATAPAYGELLEKLFKKEFSEELTPAAQETLAIIAYAGPVTRAEIEYIRGVNSSFTIRNLLIRGVVERESAAESGGAYGYRLSFDALKHIGISKIEDLPEYSKFRAVVDEFRQKSGD
jgi:segregation and condensation protein B